MKRINNELALELKSEKSVMFINDMAAIMACNMMALYFASEGFLTTTHMSKENGSYEVCIHFNLDHYPILPQGYLYTSYTITSHDHYFNGEQHRIRCKTYRFSVKTCIRQRD